MTKKQITKFIEMYERGAKNCDKKATAFLQDSDLRTRLGEDRKNAAAARFRRLAEIARTKAADLKKMISN